MARTITGHVHFEPDRSMRLVLAGPDGPVDAGTTRRSTELGRMAQDAAARIGSGPADVSLLVDRPPWLRLGMIVRMPASADTGERPRHPYGQVIGFLPVGGVVVWHPESSAGVHAPEDLVVCDPASVDPRIVGEISGRTGVAATFE
ncbi:hypothetical protein ACFFKH_16605 [Micromonospora marina]|uniref:Uncharacterized protein n=1 Tax=Micromonospora marina TaxID=307120 RepID=A0A1C4ZTS1_9ACTN|nr:hypothetical protein [Micromonospora marina]SCF36299.1 hypothetical protein GA0070215_12075 [Micromonospora marina]